MIATFKYPGQNLIRSYRRYGLIFFVFGLSIACHQSSDTTALTVQWQGKRAIGLFIPDRFLQSVPDDSLTQLLTVRLTDQETAMLGSYQSSDSGVVFEPIVPLTRGLRYGVWLRNKSLGDIQLPALASNDKPKLLAIYPTQDSLPENLLKIYLHFSRPMREGQSQTCVSLLKNGTDTLSGVFLDLQPELWDPDRTTLTLWLDPGRIKRDLQPNQRLGTPLQIGARYQVVVSANWPDAQGASLGKTTLKSFLAVQRDSLSPNPAQWRIRLPQGGSIQPLTLSFGEPLDFSLLTETIHILDGAGKPVMGSWQFGNGETQSAFRPEKPWQTGQYRLRFESRLEDIAGNNLNRPFDRDITQNQHQNTTKSFFERQFWIR